MAVVKLASKVLATNLGMFMPYELNFAITYRCISHCRVCNIWKRKPHGELTLEEIKRIAKKTGFVHWLRLTGGEPFLRRDYVDIVKAFDKNLDLFFLISPTNGLLPDIVSKRVEKVLKFYEKRYAVTVSIDGPKKIHDHIRGTKGAWDNAVETLLKLKQLQADHKNFRVFVGYTISPYNLGFFKKAFNELSEMLPINASDFHINLFQSSDIFYGMQMPNMKKSYFTNVCREIDTILEMQGSRTIVFDPTGWLGQKHLKLAKQFLRTGKMPVRCNIFNLSCFLDPMGNVYPCTVFDRKLGNIRDYNYDLKKILTSETAKKVRKEIEADRCPQCWTPCEAHQMILSNWLKL
jgi:MoaA/NifB/PqqE/SkfB family radical SAM enzyme